MRIATAGFWLLMILSANVCEAEFCNDPKLPTPGCPPSVALPTGWCCPVTGCCSMMGHIMQPMCSAPPTCPVMPQMGPWAGPMPGMPGPMPQGPMIGQVPNNGGGGGSCPRNKGPLAFCSRGCECASGQCHLGACT